MDAIKIKYDVTISEQMLADLIITAFEGGINYWVRGVRYINKKEVVGDTPSYVVTILYEDGGCEVDAGDGIKEVLTRQKLIEGLQLMADKYPAKFEDIVMDNVDADTADLLIQLALFKEVVFG